MEILAQIVGLLAVTAFLLSYQQKKRKHIVLLSVTCRCLYILQYLLLGAFAGAVMDILGVISAGLATKKHLPGVKKHTKLIVILTNVCLVAAGVTIAYLNHRWIDLFSILGVTLHTSALWLSDEQQIRWVTLAGSPFWCAYNVLSRAYGSAIGDFLSICSLVIAIVRYRKRPGQNVGEPKAL